MFFTCQVTLNFTETQVFTARELIAQGVPKAAVARELGVSRQTLYTALKGEGRYGTDRVDAEQEHS